MDWIWLAYSTLVHQFKPNFTRSSNHLEVDYAHWLIYHKMSYLSANLPMWYNRIGCISLTILCIELSNDSSNHLPGMTQVTLVAFVWIFSIVYFHIFPQGTWINGCIITLVTLHYGTAAMERWKYDFFSFLRGIMAIYRQNDTFTF